MPHRHRYSGRARFFFTWFYFCDVCDKATTRPRWPWWKLVD